MKSFLIVDDDSVVRALLSQILLILKVPVLAQVEDAVTAIEVVKEKKPDVVFLDINLPGGADGFSVLRFVRTKFPAIKVIMISADATKVRVQEAIKEGASGFIAKPIDTRKVGALVKKFLQA